ncbi:hypothetical protein CHS0354_011729 [Potamilus streckersoni]|uniref:Uncharacterized protein n=1 Tax=Potamilus streckersoni TaxID=2493646 RepID=A0AAE0SJ77_9BIVA|nr:hypothetical protein CHS0354_011729 [Potamilus streckersoni]
MDARTSGHCAGAYSIEKFAPTTQPKKYEEVGFDPLAQTAMTQTSSMQNVQDGVKHSTKPVQMLLYPFFSFVRRRWVTLDVGTGCVRPSSGCEQPLSVTENTIILIAIASTVRIKATAMFAEEFPQYLG